MNWYDLKNRNLVIAALKVLDKQWSQGTANSGFDEEVMTLLGRGISQNPSIHESQPRLLIEMLEQESMVVVPKRRLNTEANK